MAKFNVELFGLSNEITALKNVDIDLNDGASLKDVVAALRSKIPAMEGSVIRTGQDRLTERYVFNVDGRFYFDTDNARLNDGDHIRLLLLSTGG